MSHDPVSRVCHMTATWMYPTFPIKYPNYINPKIKIQEAQNDTNHTINRDSFNIQNFQILTDF